MDEKTFYGKNLFDTEKDNCAIIARVRKDGVATHGNVKRTILALETMGHRTGEIDQEGDGAGIQTDIPRQIWLQRLEQANVNSYVAYMPNFIIVHLMIKPLKYPSLEQTLNLIYGILSKNGFDIVYSNFLPTKNEFLGQRAKNIEQHIWSIAIVPTSRNPISDKTTHTAHLEIEKELSHVYVVSFSRNSVIYKVRGDVKTLINYYPDLKNPNYKSAISLAHGRYSTNTDSNHERAQMFSTLGHNGEINTIMKLRNETALMGMPVVCRGSDSQDVDRLIENLMFYNNSSLMEAMEIVFPPIWSEIEKMDDDLKNMYTYYRRLIGMIAQGPAAIIARQGDEVVFSVDALGLRPLWFGETDKEFFASSEKGVIETEQMQSTPIPLAPGEKRGFLLRRPITQLDAVNSILIKGGTDIFDYTQLQQQALKEFKQRRNKISECITPNKILQEKNILLPTATNEILKFYGWHRDDTNNIELISIDGKDPVGATGYDGALAVLRDGIINIPEFIKETVAVVTNPAIDRERESSHFSLQTFLGAKPNLDREDLFKQIKLSHPILLDAEIDSSIGTKIDNLFSDDGPKIIIEKLECDGKNPKERLDNFIHFVITKIKNTNSSILILTDAGSSESTNALDPFITLGRLNEELSSIYLNDFSIRRKTSIVLHSGQLRNVHDCCVAIGLGADAIAPYLIWKFLSQKFSDESLNTSAKNVLKYLIAGVEKVISTMGIHDLSGYSKIFASIGLADEIIKEIGITAALSEGSSFGFEKLEKNYELRFNSLKIKSPTLVPDNRLNVKIWKTISEVAQNKVDYKTLEDYYQKLILRQPATIKHIIGLKNISEPKTECDISVDYFDAPFFISAMSFGSQGETSFRSYVEGSYQSNILCMNGEGGEIPDLLGKYYFHRGQQVASARFGVNAKLLNSSKYLEIKVGQGAKPGEGGLLPGFKVTEQIAKARHATKGIDLISPSNNHDIYSIEDLAQLVEELKSINPDSKVSVKIPAIPNIGAIACGVAKANADIITISGYDGGTGAARIHALRYVGFPVELALFEAHQFLLASGLRNKVEIWADGGIKTTDDILKLMALGANRVGFGTLAMVAIGCTICRDCHTGTCHTGITAHFPTQELAFKAGLKEYIPREIEQSTERIKHLFDEMKKSLKEKSMALGLSRLSDLVGKRQFLYQTQATEKINLSPLFVPSIYNYDQNLLTKEKVILYRPKTSLSSTIGQKINEQIKLGTKQIMYQDDMVGNRDRALGTSVASNLAKASLIGKTIDSEIELDFSGTTIPGNGLGAFITDGITIRVIGGGQDGIAKSASGGKIVILKGNNHDGLLVDGSVGKCFAYGAQKGKFFIQGFADSRACIRLSGAQIVFGARLIEPLKDEQPNIASRAHLKGFAFEYMTGGEVVVLGDPGPWLCSGFSGGVIYNFINEKLGMNVEALKRRIAPGGKVYFSKPNKDDHSIIKNLLQEYIDELILTGQQDQIKESEEIKKIMEKIKDNFVSIRSIQDANYKIVKKENLIETSF